MSPPERSPRWAGEAPAVSVVIPSVDGAHHLGPCLASLARSRGPRPEVVVVDGGSADGTRAVCAASALPVRLVALPRNVGYAAAVNAGLAAARGDDLVVLNNDVEVAPDFLERLVATAHHAGAELVAPRVLVLDRPGVIDNTGNDLYADGLNLCRARGEPDEVRHRVAVDPLLPSGAALLIRRSLLERIGGFDERFFAYGEDAEFGLRALRAGAPVRYAPDAVVHHRGGGTWGPDSLRKAFLVERNRGRLAALHFPAGALLRSPLHLAARYAEHLRAGWAGAGPLARFRGGVRPVAAGVVAAAGVAGAVLALPGDLRRRRELAAAAILPEEGLAATLRLRAVGLGRVRQRRRW